VIDTTNHYSQDDGRKFWPNSKGKFFYGKVKYRLLVFFFFFLSFFAFKKNEEETKLGNIE